ncbi:hypothetical protein SMACR_08462 [Sordaria macrospora]|uniref:WGS project CABT00000000 data, contig 2.58 n=2 Tax=Sordaria macrospora TaxID=5147 RepID=F7WA58_SORMK|nr:uncharacterized protein SMAC_08462 [Sordaria macrospora k-hell]KAA8628130.1 hypothetical protein SMACR_08462 [Sordaria macrospora]KAH7635161.1 hypothetical protein B0T09DRAFT_18991 [Sordaria sp. MPI-SDFR-AT-0083]WPJ58087.1 hypothetical protein SMAC4_08462 [Sordaria macrospora]CCC14121.1 unnamed protein product [Sordaria macrospora k-hell]
MDRRLLRRDIPNTPSSLMVSLPHKVTTPRKVKCNINNSLLLSRVAAGTDASKGASRLSAAASWAPNAVNAALTAANAAPSAVKRVRTGIAILTVEDGFEHESPREITLGATWAQCMRNTTHMRTTHGHTNTRD